MRCFSRPSRLLLLISLLLGIIGCASVPKEVVELSYRTGEDIAALYQSYDKLIHEFYEKMRAERIAYLTDTWYPRFLLNWMEKGELVAIAKGEKIWSEEQEKLIPKPPDADPQETVQTLQDWVDYALYAYEVKEDVLLKPLNDGEMALRQEVESAFHQVIRANAVITAHLNSLRKVKEVQDQALEALRIKNLRDRINKFLFEASEKAAEGLQEIQKKDKELDDLTKQIDSLKNKIK